MSRNPSRSNQLVIASWGLMDLRAQIWPGRVEPHTWADAIFDRTIREFTASVHLIVFIEIKEIWLSKKKFHFKGTPCV